MLLFFYPQRFLLFLGSHKRFYIILNFIFFIFAFHFILY